MKKQFAVFNLDGSIVRKNLLEIVTSEMISRGQLDIGPGTQLIDFFNRYHDSEKITEINKQSIEFMFKNLRKGIDTEVYDKIIELSTKHALADTYLYTRELLQSLKNNNFFLIAVSNSEMKLVGSIAKSLGFDAWIGKYSFVENKKKLDGKYDILKQTNVEVINNLIQKFGLETKASTAVGSTISDLEFLNLVETQIVFNPSQTLFKEARSKGWMVVLERKDMIYGLMKQGDEYEIGRAHV